MTSTERIFKNVETGCNYRLYTSCDASNYHLISEGNESVADGSEVNGFYLAAHTGATIKLNTGVKIFVDAGQFYNLKAGEVATHRKFIGFDKFSKI